MITVPHIKENFKNLSDVFIPSYSGKIKGI